MARDRQRSKQRQQQRREERLAQRREPMASDATRDAAAADGKIDAEEQRDIEELVDLEVGAPPEDVGFSERTARKEPRPPSSDTDEEPPRDEPVATPAGGPRGSKGEREG